MKLENLDLDGGIEFIEKDLKKEICELCDLEDLIKDVEIKLNEKIEDCKVDLVE